MADGSTITAIVATRDRGASAATTVLSLLASDHPSFEVLVVDQSIDDSTEIALRPFDGDARFRYVRSATVGLGRARNVGANLARTPYLAFTDDDCEVMEDWLSVITSILDEHPEVLTVYTNVEAGPHDQQAGFVPTYVRSRDALASSVLGKTRARGIGAGMAVRREPFLTIGGFDENMGAGGRFHSAEDRDLAIRTVINGWSVYETAATAVVHHGFRTWQQGRQLTERDWLGLGAMCAKPLRAGHWSTIVYPLHELVVNGTLAPLCRLAYGRRPQGFRRIYYFIKGFRVGWRTPIDRDHLVFLADEDRWEPVASRAEERT